MDISIIICTYNPVLETFKNCLKHLNNAIKFCIPTEVLLIDNNSDSPIRDFTFVQNFVAENNQTRIIVESNQGLTPARLRGIKESKGDLLIFIDDDNYVAQNFIANAKNIVEKYPFIGSFSGKVEVISNIIPPKWTEKYWGMLVHRVFEGNRWGNQQFNNEIIPCGAGLCVTREVAQYYLQLHADGKRTFQLDRSKDSLLSGGDNDLAMCACDIDKGMGIFDSLYLKHFIPENRFTLFYLEKLSYGIYYSYVVLKYIRTEKLEIISKNQKIKHFINSLFLSKNDRRISKSWHKGIKDAITLISQNKTKFKI